MLNAGFFKQKGDVTLKNFFVFRDTQTAPSAGFFRHIRAKTVLV